MVKLEELIVIDQRTAGSGTSPVSPIRRILEVYSKEGRLLATHDPNGGYTQEKMFDFAEYCRKRPDVPINVAWDNWPG